MQFENFLPIQNHDSTFSLTETFVLVALSPYSQSCCSVQFFSHQFSPVLTVFENPLKPTATKKVGKQKTKLIKQANSVPNRNLAKIAKIAKIAKTGKP